MKFKEAVIKSQGELKIIKKEKDAIFTKAKLGPSKITKIPLTISDELSFFVATIIGDGHLKKSKLQTTIGNIKATADAGLTKQQLSWDELNSKVNSLNAEVASLQRQIADHSESVSQKKVAQVRQAIESFNPEKLNSENWKIVIELSNQISEAKMECGNYPLAPLEPWSAEAELDEISGVLEQKVEKLSGPVANQVEALTRNFGFKPHSGRRLVVSAVEHKWAILGLIIVIFFIFRSRKD